MGVGLSLSPQLVLQQNLNRMCYSAMRVCAACVLMFVVPVCGAIVPLCVLRVWQWEWAGIQALT